MGQLFRENDTTRECCRATLLTSYYAHRAMQQIAVDWPKHSAAACAKIRVAARGFWLSHQTTQGPPPSMYVRITLSASIVLSA
jgi:hypothetical protein